MTISDAEARFNEIYNDKFRHVIGGDQCRFCGKIYTSLPADDDLTCECQVPAPELPPAQRLLAAARADLESMTDGADGTQMHRRAVIGKNLYVCAHGSRFPEGGFGVSIRVEGQYIDRAYIRVANRIEQNELVAELEKLLAENPIGIES